MDKMLCVTEEPLGSILRMKVGVCQPASRVRQFETSVFQTEGKLNTFLSETREPVKEVLLPGFLSHNTASRWTTLLANGIFLFFFFFSFPSSLHLFLPSFLPSIHLSFLPPSFSSSLSSMWILRLEPRPQACKFVR